MPNLAPMNPPASPRDQQIAQILLFITPALFTANMVLARATADFIPPVALSGMRWLGVVLVLLPFCWQELWRSRNALRREWRQLAVLGFLGMGICGAVIDAGDDHPAVARHVR